jgi:hypothetical protein
MSSDDIEDSAENSISGLQEESDGESKEAEGGEEIVVGFSSNSDDEFVGSYSDEGSLDPTNYCTRSNKFIAR